MIIRAIKSNQVMTDIVVKPAQAFHRVNETVRIQMMGWSGKVEVKPLSNKEAVELGAELFGEAFIMAVAISTMYAENLRSKRKEAAREQTQNEHLAALQEQITSLQELQTQQNCAMTQLTHTMRTMLVQRMGQLKQQIHQKQHEQHGSTVAVEPTQQARSTQEYTRNFTASRVSVEPTAEAAELIQDMAQQIQTERGEVQARLLEQEVRSHLEQATKCIFETDTASIVGETLTNAAAITVEGTITEAAGRAVDASSTNEPPEKVKAAPVSQLKLKTCEDLHRAEVSLVSAEAALVSAEQAVKNAKQLNADVGLAAFEGWTEDGQGVQIGDE